MHHDALARLSALFGTLAWIIPAGLGGLAVWIGSTMPELPAIHADTIHAASHSSVSLAASAHVTSPLLGTVAVALVAFGALSLGTPLAGLSLALGRRARLAGAQGLMLTGGLATATAWFVVLGLLVLSALVAT